MLSVGFLSCLQTKVYKTGPAKVKSNFVLFTIQAWPDFSFGYWPKWPKCRFLLLKSYKRLIQPFAPCFSSHFFPLPAFLKEHDGSSFPSQLPSCSLAVFFIVSPSFCSPLRACALWPLPSCISFSWPPSAGCWRRRGSPTWPSLAKWGHGSSASVSCASAGVSSHAG